MSVEIVPYRSEYKASFRDLNYEWIERYFRIEPIDTQVLENPEAEVLDKGGRIFFALKDGEAVGVASLIPKEEGVVEFSKMGVNGQFQGEGIGRLLVERCLEEARRMGASRVILYTNSSLLPAIHLYTRFGFKHVVVFESGYERADVMMELFLGKDGA